MFRDFLFLLIINSIIGLFLTSLGFGDGLLHNFIFSQAIGISCYSAVRGSYQFYRNRRPVQQILAILLALSIGIATGMFVSILLTGRQEMLLTRWPVPLLLKVFLFSLLFGTAVSYFFLSRKMLTENKILVKEEKIKRLANEKKVLEMHLKLLQAQIEPHFLFNTLSNIDSLMDEDPAKAKKMLLDFTAYLRSSLACSRENEITVAKEMKMIQAYLDIFKIRMGNRLQYKIDITPDAADLKIPSMLIQPLVENSIKHGLEPAIEGGTISIGVLKENNILHISIADTGVGLDQTADNGIGTDNIRERLRSLFGEQGKLIVAENTPRGVKTIIEIPYDDTGNNS